MILMMIIIGRQAGEHSLGELMWLRETHGSDEKKVEPEDDRVTLCWIKMQKGFFIKCGFWVGM